MLPPDTAKIRNTLMLIRTLTIRLEKDTDRQIDQIVAELEKLEDISAKTNSVR